MWDLVTQYRIHGPVSKPLNAEQLAALNAANTGFAQHIGMEITFCSGERLECFLDVRPEHLQAGGVVNGGVYASIGETLGSAGAIATSGQSAVGMSNTTDLLKSVSGGRIEAIATPVHRGARTHLWRIEMHNDGQLVAVTNLKLMLLAG